MKLINHSFFLVNFSVTRFADAKSELVVCGVEIQWSDCENKYTMWYNPRPTRWGFLHPTKDGRL